MEPDIWLLDEPFSALDPLIRKRMQDEFLRIQSKLQKSIVFITHDFQEALRLADRMAIMRDGMIVQIGRPVDLILNPVDDYVKSLQPMCLGVCAVHQMFAVKLLDQLKEWASTCSHSDRQSAWVSCEKPKRSCS